MTPFFLPSTTAERKPIRRNGTDSDQLLAIAGSEHGSGQRILSGKISYSGRGADVRMAAASHVE
jgi:hypothetical protein